MIKSKIEEVKEKIVDNLIEASANGKLFWEKLDNRYYADSYSCSIGDISDKISFSVNDEYRIFISSSKNVKHSLVNKNSSDELKNKARSLILSITEYNDFNSLQNIYKRIKRVNEN